jgi:hypothetical protein
MITLLGFVTVEVYSMTLPSPLQIRHLFQPLVHELQGAANACAVVANTNTHTSKNVKILFIIKPSSFFMFMSYGYL